MLDLTLTRNMHINTGNFSNVDVGVQLTLKDVDPAKQAAKMLKLQELADALMAKETISVLGEMETVNAMGADKYAKSLSENESEINKTLLNAIKTLAS